MQRTAVVDFLVGCLAFATVPALAEPADDAARAFANGKALLAEAEFDGALQAFRTAAKADAGNQDYTQTYSMLRQVLRMREEIEKEQDPEKWMSTALALRAFYHDHRIYSESLPLDRQIHERHLAPDSAAMLAETLLALGKNAEAGELLGNVGEKEATPRTNVLLGLSLARQGRIDEAKAAVMKAGVDQDAGPLVFYELARLHALTGESKAALEALTRSFEHTPPGQVDALKTNATACEDFSTLADSSDFNEVLKTQSKVKESACSKGPSCGDCPKRAKCGKGQKTTP